jgi:hypothetical protein
MMPILESLANNVSALPAAASTAQSFSNARGSGGFAATLAAAQEQSTTAQSGSSNGQGSDLPDSNGSVSGGTTNATLGVANNFNVRAVASGTAQLRKTTGNAASNNSMAVALAGAAMVNSPLPQPIAITAVPLVPAIVPAISAAATGSPIPTTAPLAAAAPQPNVSLPNLLQANEPQASFSQTSVQQSIPEQSGALPSSVLQSTVLRSGLPQTGFPANSASVTASAQTSGIAAGNTPPMLAATDISAATAGAPVLKRAVLDPAALKPAPDSASSGSASLSSVTSSLPAAASGSFTATGASVESTAQEIPAGTTTATVSVAAPATTLSSAPANQSASAGWNGLQNNQGSVEPVVLAENTPPSQFSSAFGQSTVSTLPASAFQPDQWNANVSESVAGPSTQNQTVNVTPPSSNLLANAFSEAVSQPGLPPSGDGGQAGESNASSDGAQGNVTSSFPIPANTAAPISNVSTPSAQTPSAAILNLAAQMLASKAPVPVSAPVAAPQLTTAPNSTPVRAAAGHQSAPASTSTAGAGANSATTLPIASQTPFSVFFSNAGPGTESAASALPKIVTPVSASAIHLTNSSFTNSSAGGTQGTSATQASSQSAGSQNPTAKDALSGTNSGSLQTTQALHRETDPSVTGLAVAASQSTAIPAPAPPVASGITASPVAMAADSAAKPEAPPTPAPESPVIMAPAPPPTPPTAIPGPVQVAQMVNRVGQSEMRIGMNTSAFGTVDVRTVVHASDVGLVIGSEKGDLRGLMSNEMPGINNSLQQQNLRLNSVSFMQGFASPGNGNGSGGGNSQQQFWASQRGSSNSLLPEIVDDSVESTSASEYGSSRGLSILA